MTSSDLATWSVQSTGVTHTLRSVAVSPSRIVAVGESEPAPASNPEAIESIVLSSADGSTWVKAFRSTDCSGIVCTYSSQLSKVIWTGTQFVAVGTERAVGTRTLYALILTSPDGVVWTKRASQAIEVATDWPIDMDLRFPLGWVSSIAWSGSKFVLAGVKDGDTVVWTSTDAEAWTLISGLPTATIDLTPFADVTWASGRFVAVNVAGWTGGAPVFSSVDGVRWELDRNDADLPAMNAVVGRDGEFLAVGDSYRQTSTDGLTWTVSDHLPGCGNAVLWDGTRYVAVGSGICKSQ